MVSWGWMPRVAFNSARSLEATLTNRSSRMGCMYRYSSMNSEEMRTCKPNLDVFGIKSSNTKAFGDVLAPSGAFFEGEPIRFLMARFIALRGPDRPSEEADTAFKSSNPMRELEM